jgi:hypothetical protein
VLVVQIVLVVMIIVLVVMIIVLVLVLVSEAPLALMLVECIVMTMIASQSAVLDVICFKMFNFVVVVVVCSDFRYGC